MFPKSINTPTLRLLSVFSSLLILGCIRDGDFERLNAKRIDGWSYTASIDQEGRPYSIATTLIKADETGVDVALAFKCSSHLNLSLVIETFLEDSQQEAPIRMHKSSTPFGKYLAAEIKGYNNHMMLSWQGTQVDNQPNAIRITLEPPSAKKEKELKTPRLKLSIPMQNLKRDITIDLNNANIQRIFTD